MVRKSGPGGQSIRAYAAQNLSIPAPAAGTAILCPLDDGSYELYLAPDIRLLTLPRPDWMPEWAWEQAVPASHQPLLWPRYTRLLVPLRRTAEGKRREALFAFASTLSPEGLVAVYCYAVRCGLSLDEALTRYMRYAEGRAA